jgi:hypothetical protein
MWRAMTSVLIAFSFLVLVVSGIVLFVAPPGRVANWTNWRLAGGTKHEWIDLHTCFALLFLLAAILHLIFNLRPMINYFKNRQTRQLSWRAEWIVALGIALLVFAGARAGWVPFASFMAMGERAKNSWEEPQARAPIPHAELFTISELADQAGVPLSNAIQRLQSQQLQAISPDILTINLATSNDVSAQRIYEIIQGPAAAYQSEGGSAGGRPGHGGGTGWKTLAQYCVETGLDLNEALARLEARGIKAAPDQILRDIAQENGFDRPFELVEILSSP